MSELFKRNPLFFSFLSPSLTDGIITLLGQDRTFWQDYRTVNEASPAYFFLIVHPGLYIIGAVVWFIFLFWLMKKLKHPLNLMLALAFIAGHAWGSSAWLIRLVKNIGLYLPYDRISILAGWTVLVLYYVLIGIIAALSINQYFKNRYRT